MSGEIESALEQYERATAALQQNLAGLIETFMPPDNYYFLRHCKAVREAEEQDRAEWLADVKQRLGLVAIGETPR